MITAFRLLKRVGKFKDVTAGRSLPLGKLSLVYAENGRGKTTLAAILKSLGSGDGALVLERRRLGEVDGPEIVIETSDGTSVFREGKWDIARPQVQVFDDEFVARNVHAGMVVDSGHRQRLHDLIIGARGVRLNEALQAEIQKNEEHIKALAKRGELVPKRLRGDLPPDKFVDLPEVPNLADALATSERALATAREADSVARHPNISIPALPRFDIDAIVEELAKGLRDVQRDALSRVGKHLRALGKGGETWVAEGHAREPLRRETDGEAICPYCAQPLSGSPIVDHYADFFSEAYQGLKASIGTFGKELAAQHTGNAVADFERSVRLAQEEVIYWSRFVTVPANPTINTESLVTDWNRAAEAVLALLRQKFAAPLEPFHLPQEVNDALNEYNRRADLFDDGLAYLRRVNSEIALAKERAANANLTALERENAGLRLTQARYSDEGREVCDKYEAERRAKAETEKRREQARQALDDYRRRVFPAYEERINHYLAALHTGFSLTSFVPANSRQGSSASYQVLLDDISTPIGLSPSNPTEPSIKTTLSAGDRNALALAFFLTSLEIEPDPSRVVLFDDPMTSLDEHRTLATIKEVLALRQSCSQVIILSHSKPFLFAVWEETTSNDDRSAIKVERDSRQTSTLTEWDVSKDAITLHDQRCELVLRYLDSSVGIDARKVAEALRPMLEAFVRVAYPDSCPPSTMLGQFLRKAEQSMGRADQILSPGDFAKLTELKDYANQFHHDTNPLAQSQVIHDAQLQHFAAQVIKFMRRG